MSVVERPNREKASSKATRAIVVVLLMVSAVLVAIVTVAGWDMLVGAKGVQIGFIAVYLAMAFYIVRWNRGLLPVAAALAILLGIFAAVAGPEWFDRNKEGFDSPPLGEDVLGLLTLLLVPLQLLLIAFAMRGFQQAWHVEVERTSGPAPAAG